jgi:transposase InsO family protein
VKTLIRERLRDPSSASATRLCQISGLSRATFYRTAIAPEDASAIEARDRLQELACEYPTYGYRRLTAALQRDGFRVNHKRVLRLMREDNLLCLRKKRFTTTTDSSHGLPIYPNLAPTLTLTGLDQLWCADLTYIRLGSEFIYLAVILDIFSRRVIGWELGRSLEAALAISALKQALGQRTVKPGLAHHSDRGVQYASREYTDLLKESGITISMSRKGNPYDNAFAESFMKTLKYEEAYLQEYEGLQDAKASIERFLEEVCNQKRLRSSLGYLPPMEFEHHHLQQPVTTLALINLP